MNRMDKETKKDLRRQYEARHPDKGIACWQCGDEMWVSETEDAQADYNSTGFQLRLGSWPGKELQKRYKENPEEFTWSLIRRLEYEDPALDYREDLELLMMEFMEEHPEAKRMKPGRKRK